MPHSPASARAALLLTNRLVALDAKPLTARELWELVGEVDPAELVDRDAAGIAELTGGDEQQARRLRSLLDAATAFGFAQERLADGGLELVSALDGRFPPALRARLGPACPPWLVVAGPIGRLTTPGLGVVGSDAADEHALGTARAAAEMAAQHGWPVVSGLADAVDRSATAGAFDAGGTVVGVPAQGILRASRPADIRRRVLAGELCLASPYPPDASLRAGNALARNKILYALSRMTFVVASESGSGAAWAGAKEALDHRYTRVAAWTGAPATDGNLALVRGGASPVTEPSQLFRLDPDLTPPPLQDSLF